MRCSCGYPQERQTSGPQAARNENGHRPNSSKIRRLERCGLTNVPLGTSFFSRDDSGLPHTVARRPQRGSVLRQLESSPQDGKNREVLVTPNELFDLDQGLEIEHSNRNLTECVFNSVRH